MTPSEFKAWFDGFTEAFTGSPTKAQWSRIKARVAEIDGKPVTERVYVDRYWPTYWSIQRYGNPIYLNCNATTGGSVGIDNTSGMYSQNASAQAYQNALTTTYSSHDAMNALGKAEALELAA